MKKIAIAGASVALAAMPMAGVFAVDWTDQFTTNIQDACTVVRATTAHPSGEASSWTTDSQDATKDTFAIGAVTNGQTKADFAHSSFKVSCNKDKGYTLSVGTAGFTRTEAAPTGVTVDTWAYNAGGLADNGSSWTLAATGDVTGQNLASNIISQTARSTVDEIEVSYSLKVGATQQPGNYTASAAYTLTPNS